uniref:Sperm associated antigen 5 n=1 Tax=Equus caballus TaxID=9796 RepID=A0A9L0R3B7_HORSE
MWRVKTLNFSLSPSPQPGKPAVRTPLRELTLQPSALTSSGKRPPLCSSLTPSLCKLGLQESNSNSSPLDFVNAKRKDSPSEQFSHPSKWLEACQHESDEQPLDLIPPTNSTPRICEEAVDPVDDSVVKTMVLIPFPVGQQQDITLEAHLDTMAETNSIILNEPLRPGDLLREGVAPCMEDSFSEVVPAMPEKPTFQDPPSHLLEYPPNPCSEQQLPFSKEGLMDRGTEAVPEDLVLSESNAVLPSSMLWLSPSTALAADFLVSHVDPGEETIEHRAVEGREMSFPTTLPEEAELGDQALVSNMEDILPTCLTPNLGEMESQVAPGPAVEDAGRILISDTGPWMSPLAWLEKGVNTSVMLENLRQSLSLPSVLRDAAIGTTPLSTCSVGTWLTPPAPQEKSTNTSQTGLVGTKDSISETEHLLRGHPPDLTALSRHDLEDNLLNSLVILEVLSCQLRDWKTKLTVPHPEVQDSSTQTDTSPSEISKKPQHLQESQEIGQALQQARNVMQSWVLVSKELISLLHLSLLHLEEDKTTVSQESRRAETLVSCCFDVLKKLRARLQSLKAETEEAKHREEMALRGKDVAETVLEAFCAHASQRISQLEQDLASMGEFRGLLKETQTQLVSRELEQVSTHLEDCKVQVEQLKLENSHLATDLQAQLQILTSMESQLKELQSQHAHCTHDLAMKDELICQLTQNNEEQAAQWQKEEMALKHMQAELQQQQAVLAKEVQDLKETLEFADQENQVAHLELGQVEYQLKTTLEVLRERSLQCEDLKDTVENLKAKLASTIAENQEQDLEKTRQYSQELGVLTEQLQSLTLFLQTKLKEKADLETLLISTACAPAQEHPLPTDSAFLGSILTAVADEEPEAAPVPLLGSDKSAFTRVASMVSLQPTETPGMEKSLAEMTTMTLELQSLCSLLQESKEEAVRTLQQKICDLQARLQVQEEQHQEAQKAKEADIEKLNQALCLRYKNEKELQEVIQQQNEKILEQIDKSGELISLREEVTQLTRSLRRAETETKVLQETLAGQLNPDCQPMATDWIQEKVWLSQEVDKLRVMFLEMKNEKAKLMVKFQSHRNILEENLRRSDKELKKLDDIVQHIYETLLSIPEVVRGCKELQGLMEFLS